MTDIAPRHPESIDHVIACVVVCTCERLDGPACPMHEPQPDVVLTTTHGLAHIADAWKRETWRDQADGFDDSNPEVM